MKAALNMVSILAMLLGAPAGCSRNREPGEVPFPDGGVDTSADGGGGDGATGDGTQGAPPNTVVGRWHTTCHQRTGDVDLPSDLSQLTIQALIPDSTSPTGYRVSHGTGRADGSFTIPDVPDGITYILQVDIGHYVTDQHVIDGRGEVTARCVPRPAFVASPTPVTFQLTGMAPFSTNFPRGSGADFLEIASRPLGFEDFSISNDDLVRRGDTTINATIDWGQGSPLLDAASGDDLYVLHGRQTSDNASLRFPGDFFRDLVDVFHTTTATLQDGVPTTIAGSFQPAAPNRTISISLDRALFDAGYDGMGQPGMSVEIAADDGPSVATFFVNNVSRSMTLVHTVTDRPYADPFPSNVGRSAFVGYQQIRAFQIPEGGANHLQVRATGNLQRFALPGAIDPRPRLQPPSGITIAGLNFGLGGKVPFDGRSPVVVRWNTVASATSYKLSLSRVSGDQGDEIFRTTGTALNLPAASFENGAFYLFTLEAIQAANDYSTGHVIPIGIASQAEAPSGRFRFTASCGDGVMQPGEDCDTAGESATCNVDCTLPLCGDGLRNAAAGEACDSAGDTLGCNADCTLPVCGDNHVNFTLENCDDGNTTDDGNGCGSDCKVNDVCGNGHVETLGEQCDGGGVDTATCDSDCTFAVCGDGHANAAAGEECDEGGLNGTGHCSFNCKLQ